jgi:hypothetical protein
MRPAAAPLNPTLPIEQRRRRAIYMVLRGGVDFGGDDIVQIIGTDSTETIQAGQRYFVGAGVLYDDPSAPLRLMFEATIGYKWQSSDVPNGNVAIGRVPFEAILSVTPGGFRFGGGFVAHFATNYQCKVQGQCDLDVELDDAFGGILQLGYHLGDEVGIDLGVRGTFIEYPKAGKINGIPFRYDGSYDGSCLGFFIGGWL